MSPESLRVTLSFSALDLLLVPHTARCSWTTDIISVTSLTWPCIRLCSAHGKQNIRFNPLPASSEFLIWTLYWYVICDGMLLGCSTFFSVISNGQWSVEHTAYEPISPHILDALEFWNVPSMTFFSPSSCTLPWALLSSSDDKLASAVCGYPEF